MIIISDNDVIIFAITLVLLDFKSIITYLMHYNKNKSLCLDVAAKWFSYIGVYFDLFTLLLVK